MRKNAGFTVIELLTALVLVIAIFVLAIAQKNDLDASKRDQQRKAGVNAIYYALKNGYYLQNKYYPTSVDAKKLPYIDPASFKTIGDDNKYDIHYRGLDCTGENCKRFEIKVELEKEATYQKSN